MGASFLSVMVAEVVVVGGGAVGGLYRGVGGAGQEIKEGGDHEDDLGGS